MGLRFGEFQRQQRGSVAIFFAIAATMLMGAIGLAIDYARFTKSRIGVQGALDAAVLAASKSTVPDDQRQKVFETVFAANLNDSSLLSAPSFTFQQGSGGHGEITLTQDNLFMAALGRKTARQSLSARANTDGSNLEIVMALDISGSMQASMPGASTRLAALKASAIKLIDTVMASKTGSTSVKFSIVPFNMAVNVGTSDTSFVDGVANPLFSGSAWGGCVLERRNGFHHKSIYNAGALDGSGRWQAYAWPPGPNGTANACLNPSNGSTSGYASVEPAPLGKDPWRDGPNFNCPRYPLVRLTNNDSAVRTAIQDLNAYGNMGTTIGPAVGWATRVLSPSGPFNDGAAFDRSTRKIMVVLTDGELVTDGTSNCGGQTNTSGTYAFDPASLNLQGRKLTAGQTNDSFTPYGFIFDSNPYNVTMNTALDADKELDRLALEACSEAKSKANLELFTIAVSTATAAGTRAYDVLSKCATSAGHMFYAADADSLDKAFGAIADEAVKLRITR